MECFYDDYVFCPWIIPFFGQVIDLSYLLCVTVNKIPKVDDTSEEGFIFARVSEPLIQHGGEGLAKQSRAVHRMEERR